MARTRTGEAAERRRVRAVEIGNAPFEHDAYAEAYLPLQPTYPLNA